MASSAEVRSGLGPTKQTNNSNLDFAFFGVDIRVTAEVETRSDLHPGTRNAKRRTTEEIAHDIIKAADAGVRKTALIYGACLNPGQLKIHLGRLIEGGFVERDSATSLYRATQKGKRFMKGFERYSETKRLLAEQRHALEEFWRNDDESDMKEAVGEGHSRRKPDAEPDGR